MWTMNWGLGRRTGSFALEIHWFTSPMSLQVKEFMRQVVHVLKPGGLFLVQVVNYDRILDNLLKGLPTIENDQICFERVYRCADQPERIRFNTRLTVKSSGKVVGNEVPLLALCPHTIRRTAQSLGLNSIREYGGWKPDPFTPDSLHYILVAQKPSPTRMEL